MASTTGGGGMHAFSTSRSSTAKGSTPWYLLAKASAIFATNKQLKIRAHLNDTMLVVRHGMLLGKCVMEWTSAQKWIKGRVQSHQKKCSVNFDAHIYSTAQRAGVLSLRCTRP